MRGQCVRAGSGLLNVILIYPLFSLCCGLWKCEAVVILPYATVFIRKDGYPLNGQQQQEPSFRDTFKWSSETLGINEYLFPAAGSIFSSTAGACPKLSACVWYHMLLFVIQGCSVGCSLELKSSTLLLLSSSVSPVTPGQYQMNA